MDYLTELHHIGSPSPRLLATRLRDAKRRYQAQFGYPPAEADLYRLDNWEQIVWLDQAIATKNIPKQPSTYTPPAPYRVFRLIDRTDEPTSCG